MEAQTAGNPMITSRLAALPETLSGGGAVLIDPDSGSIPESFALEISRLRKDKAAWETLHQKALKKSKQYDWQESARGVLGLAEEIMAEKCDSPRRLARHLIRQSDIVACQKLADSETDGETVLDDAIKTELREQYRFVTDGNYAKHNEEIAAWQVEQGIDHGLDAPERVRSLPRLQVVEERVAALPPGSRVLDYACGQGHFTCALAAQYPQLDFVGVDIAESNIKVGSDYIKRNALSNIRLSAETADSLEGEYDLILACEVLEHVPNPGEVLDQLEARLAAGGQICLTVPYGPWEEESYETIPFRTHIHHFERADLMALWGHKPGYQVISVPVRFSNWGEPMGAYRITFKGGGTASGEIDYASKLTHQAPRETVSVCMVCRDDGISLAKTLESAKSFADQIVIGLDGDPKNPGPAWEIAKRYGAKAFPVVSPIESGFDAARNQTLERAWGDWVLWIDDDEVFEWPERVVKYLRPNGYDAYAIKQHHYSVEPEGVIKTDLPCRLFRRREGVQFYGVVHEHPERGLNQGFEHVLLLPDVAICHGGYDTEDTRRDRFRRNLPLMMRDREKYPDRLLGKFLWIRDLAHINRYAFEAGSPVTPRIRLQAEEAVDLWRELLSIGQVRMALDALPYYSEAVQVLTGEGIQFELAMAAKRGGLGDQPGSRPQPLQGNFLNTDDIHQLTEAMMREKTAPFEEKYF